MTMTMNYTSIFAPERLIQDHARKQHFAWRGLLISLCVHIGGVVIIILLSQHGIEKKKATIANSPSTATIKAVLFRPSPSVDRTQPINNIESKEDSGNIGSEDRSVLTSPAEQEPASTERQIEKVTPKPPAQSPSLDIQTSQNPPVAPEVPIKKLIQKQQANRQAGRLKVSSAQAAAEYLDNYNKARIGEESANAASSYATKKRSPDIFDLRKGEDRDEKLYNQRPEKIVNCTGTTNKILTTLSGLAGGTMKCSNRSGHQRFIEARINKTPEGDEQTN
ncbi:hypothetical protein [Alteromonas hispanica]|uniref:Uncharacterized protein n=1 Tax=Alteromonas hispanica TaxID=315421 RepID=A0A6L9MX93_9ALTE|nr:hypothetical protein [Alteromonas hispanica]NDW22842.1 hypothetical protein [Alteromonas hispanica]